jgi:putative heme degradation protein
MRNNALPFDADGRAAPATALAEYCCPVVEEDASPLFWPPHRPERIDMNAFQDGWARMGSAEGFHSLLSHFGVDDFDALSLAGEIWATRITLDAFLARLKLLAELELPCILAFGPAGANRNHRILIDRVQSRKGHLHLLGDTMTFIVPKACMETAWVVTKPFAEGARMSLEVFDKRRVPLLRLRAEPDQRTRAVWRDIIGTLPLTAHHG